MSVPLWIPVTWMALALTGLFLLMWASIRDLTKDDPEPMQGWDEGHQAGMLVVAKHCASDAELCDAWEAARLAHEHRVGANG